MRLPNWGTLVTDPGLQTWQWGSEVPLLERVIFSQRRLVLFVFLLATVFLGWQTTFLKPDASFEKMIPMEHPYVRAMMRHISDLGSAGTSVQIAVEALDGDIFNPDYLEVVRQVTDEVFYLPGVNRNRLRSFVQPSLKSRYLTWIREPESRLTIGLFPRASNLMCANALAATR